MYTVVECRVGVRESIAKLILLRLCKWGQVQWSDHFLAPPRTSFHTCGARAPSQVTTSTSEPPPQPQIAKMGLVDYSSGSDSDSEQPTPAPPPAPKSSLSAFLPKPKKRAPPATTADASAPKKIVVNLQKFSDASPDDLPPTKKPRITGSSGSGLSAMLPAPKKREAAAAPVVKQRVLGGGNAPPRPEVVMHGDDDDEDGGEAEVTREKPQATSTQNTRFVPQSVARKQIQPMSAFRKKKVVGKTGDVKAAPAPVKQKVSLFGAAPTVGAVKPVQMNRGPEEYTPIMLEAPKPMQQPVGEVRGLEEVVEQVREPERVVNDIQTLAEDVGLDEDTVCDPEPVGMCEGGADSGSCGKCMDAAARGRSRLRSRISASIRSIRRMSWRGAWDLSRIISRCARLRPGDISSKLCLLVSSTAVGLRDGC